MSDLPFLDLHGSAFERGAKHGRVLKQAISENLETYFERFNASGLSTDNARKEGKKWAEVIAKQNAAYTNVFLAFLWILGSPASPAEAALPPPRSLRRALVSFESAAGFL